MARSVIIEDPFPETDDEGLATEALQRLRAGGGLGDEAGVLILRVMSRMAGHPAFGKPELVTADSVFEMTGDFIVAKGEALSETLLARVPAAGDAVGILVKTVTNWLNDKWRETAFGSVEHRLSQVLSKEPAFERRPGGTWALDGQPGGMWDGNEDDLIAAARAVAAPVPNWTSDTRRPPLTDNASLIRVLTAVLTRAGVPVPLSVLTRVCVARFPHADDPAEVTLDDSFERADTRQNVENQAVGSADMPHELAEALAIVASLTADEQSILENWDNLAAIGAKLGLGRSQAGERRRALGQRLVDAVSGHEDPQAVERQLIPAYKLLVGKSLGMP